MKGFSRHRDRPFRNSSICFRIGMLRCMPAGDDVPEHVDLVRAVVADDSEQVSIGHSMRVFPQGFACAVPDDFPSFVHRDGEAVFLVGRSAVRPSHQGEQGDSRLH